MADEKKDDAFKKNRIVWFTGEFDEDTAKNAVKSILDFQQENPKKDILLVINSYGGVVDDFIAIHDVIRHMVICDVATICIGKAMSAGQMLLISGAKGKRFILPNSRVLIHSLSSETWGTLPEMQNEIRESERQQKILDSLIIKYTKITKKKLAELMAKDSYITAQEALEMGIVDAIVKSPASLYKKIFL